ncbi:MAG: DUF1549 domain-containing protein, partial [Pirellulales bacterium]|nr:DUF1549 domain-containing protein [Pirellulales bacterium]
MVPDAKQHPIDAFVKRRLEREGLTLAEPAGIETMLRRVSFDLTGLPPTAKQVDAVRADAVPDAYERFVDQLLKSPHYGERMAMWWLDAARYSDTDGFQKDATRNNWPWRDWVVGAFNKNMPFDQFTREQFAGDLLPNATADQKLATCFHRNHMTNGEGGRDPEESRIDYVIDRVNTTGSVWLGLTLGCCQCHSHKFDPISQKDYYSLFAFFNSIDEDGRAGDRAQPFMKYKSPFVERAVNEAEEILVARRRVEGVAREKATIEFEPWLEQQHKRVKAGFQPWEVLQVTSLEAMKGSVLEREGDGTVQSSGPSPFQDDYRIIGSSLLPRVTGVRLEVFPHTTHTEGKLTRGKTGEFILTNFKVLVRQKGRSQVREVGLESAVADVPAGGKAHEKYGDVKGTLDDDPRSGWTTRGHDAKKPHIAVFAFKQPLQLNQDDELIFLLLHRSTTGNANIGRFRLSVTDQAGSAVRSLNSMPLEG